jgi:hypothetical protein
VLQFGWTYSPLGNWRANLVNAIFIATFIANDFGCLGNEWGGQYFRQSYLTLTLLSVDKSRLDVSLHQ